MTGQVLITSAPQLSVPWQGVYLKSSQSSSLSLPDSLSWRSFSAAKYKNSVSIQTNSYICVIRKLILLIFVHVGLHKNPPSLLNVSTFCTFTAWNWMDLIVSFFFLPFGFHNTSKVQRCFLLLWCKSQLNKKSRHFSSSRSFSESCSLS